MSRTAGPDELDIVAAIRAGKTRQMIRADTGVCLSRIDYIAEKYALDLPIDHERREPRVGYWGRKFGRGWGLNPRPSFKTA